MKNNEAHPARKGLIIFLFIIFFIIAYVSLIFSLFKPYYKFSINNNFIGYYKNYEDFENCYKTIINKKSENSYEITKYFSSQPTVEKVFVKNKYVQKFNNYDLIEQNIEKDYTIYQIIVNEEIQMYTKTQEKANTIIEKIKKEVKEDTKLEIKSLTTKDISSIKIEEETEEKQRKIIEANKKITSRGNFTRTNKGYIWPTISNTITSYYGYRTHPITGVKSSLHTGLDIGVSSNSPVYAVQSGTILFSGWNGGYGYQVKIQHSNGIITTYAHNNKVEVSKGQKVVQGQIIARSGSTGNSTGPHLHIEFIVNGNFKNPLNYL